ncbi:MAG: hypothetical protein HYV33_04875 [Candidatus Kerfeldbacteria bacterium]|nr:hypothetical protein [Candidatus Kerfeldbacteria bacterium]
MDEIAKKFKEQDQQLNTIVRIVADHTERFDHIEQNMVTQKDHQEVMNILDKILSLTKKKDEELTVLAHNLRLVDDKVEMHDNAIKQMNPNIGAS